MQVEDLYTDRLRMLIKDDEIELRIREGNSLWSWEIDKDTAVQIAHDILKAYGDS